jgi:hypothetical protein
MTLEQAAEIAEFELQSKNIGWVPTPTTAL